MNSSKPSRFSALITLLIILGLIAVIGYFAFRWSQPDPVATPSTNTENTPEKSPDLQNIQDQFDSL